jgi:hypothetical protein
MEAWRGEFSEVYDGLLDRESTGACGEDAAWDIRIDVRDFRG